MLLVVLAAAALAPAAWADRPLPWASGPDNTGETEAKLGEIASILAGVNAPVRCWDPAGWSAVLAQGGATDASGFVRQGSTQIELAPGICWWLDSVLAGNRPQVLCGTAVSYRFVTKRVRRHGKWVRVRVRVRVETPALPLCDDADDLSWAASTLAHESVHARGITDEAVATCWGRQRIADVLAGLGADLTYARSVQAVEGLILRLGLPPNYYSPDCRADGPLDLTPGDGRWP